MRTFLMSSTPVRSPDGCVWSGILTGVDEIKKIFIAGPCKEVLTQDHDL